MKLCTVVSAIALFAYSSQASAQGHAHHGADASGVGVVHFPNSGSKAAQAPFIRGVALLHSFEYQDAAAAFREAQRLDKSFALAYWMEALTSRQELWGMEQLPTARAVLARLGPDAKSRLAKARTSREKQFGAAVEALFADVPEQQRVRAWSDSLTRLATREPNDAEWASFSAVAMMDAMRWLTPAERVRWRDSSAALAERVFAANPSHPGGAHFVIHTNDDPVNAPRAERAARMYAKIAPASDHALHMPSHIFVQLGLWDDAASSNERAWEASVAEAAQAGVPSQVSWHTLSWLEYAYLQQGRPRAARALIDTALARMGPRSDTLPGIDPRFALDEMRFMYASHTGDWAWEPAPEVRLSETGARATARQAMRLYRTAVTAQMRGALAQASTDPLNAFADSTADPQSARFARIQARNLAVVLAAAREPRAKAIETLKSFVATDTTAPSGPPMRLIPAEVLGQLLLAEGRGAEAEEAFEQSLRLHRRRSAALLGLARARKMKGDNAGAAKAYKDLLVNWHAAEPDLPELAEVRAGAALAN